jgi:3-hydroxyacyl-[acyl-carrier-protein] dehydratase
MAPTLIYDISKIDMNRVVLGIDEIRKVIPQRHEMELLTGIVHMDRQRDAIIGFKDVGPDEFWVRGHIPGRPLMPGVLMIECAAQLCAYWTMSLHPEMGFIGFAKCDEVRFRGTIVPPSRLYMIAQMTELTRRRAVGKCQGLCNGNLVFEATITGMPV